MTVKFVVAQIVQHGDYVKEFRLRRADGSPLAPWNAGAHIVLGFTPADGTTLERHYSLVGAPGATAEYRIAVLRDENGKGGSRYLHDEIGVGTPIEVSGPFNSFPLSSKCARIVLIGGGIGITPIVSMAHELAALGIQFELIYLARSATRLVLLDELSAIPGAAITTHVSEGSARADLGAILGRYTEDAEVYACGPPALLQGIASTAPALGWPAHALHFESFGMRVDPRDAPVTVELAQLQLSVTVSPGTSILDALIAADVFVAYDCKRGECGSCFTQVISGTPLHRDVCLTPTQRAIGMCTCVSWASSERLVLDL
jgi:vanillate O-demethylase ferredoxin subunit